MSFFELIAQGDAVSRLVALLLVGMSVASWVVILWKVWLLPPQPLRQPLLLTQPPLPHRLPKRSRLTPPLLQRMQPRSNASCYEKSRHPPAFLCAAIC